MSRKLKLSDLEPMLDKGVAAPARDEVSQRAYDDVRQAVFGDKRDERAAAVKTKRALRLIDLGRSADGVRLAVSATEDDPSCVPAYVVAGAGLDQLGLLTPALGFLEEALRIAPTNPLIPAVLADIAKRNGDLDSAEKCARIASQIDPLNWRNAASLALILRDRERFDEAIELLRQQIFLFPEEPILWNTLSAVLIDQGDGENAKIFANEALRINPRYFEAMHNLGVALIDEGEFEQAHALFVKSASVNASMAQKGNGGLSRAHALLGSGRLSEGWEAYDIRVQPGKGLVEYDAFKPRWEGEGLRGRSLLLIAEQGLGDEVMFMTIAAEAVEALGPEGKLHIACEPRLMALFQRSFPQSSLYGYATHRINGRPKRAVLELDWDQVDVWAPMGDLARYFRPTLESFDGNRPFLRPDPERVATFAAQRAAFGPGLCVGIAWRSLLMNYQRQRYFADIEQWEPVLRTPGVTFVSLQPGDTAGEEARIAAQFGVTLQRFDGLDVKSDLDGIVAAARSLDLVIAPMNASSNLAAAAGVDVWFTAGHKDWSMLGAERIPWYPRSRLFLAPRAGAWSALYAKVGAALAAETATSR